MLDARPVDTRFLSREQAAEGLGVSVRTVDRLIREAEIPSVRLGKRRLIPRDDFDAYAASLRDGEAAVLAS